MVLSWAFLSAAAISRGRNLSLLQDVEYFLWQIVLWLVPADLKVLLPVQKKFFLQFHIHTKFPFANWVQCSAVGGLA